MSLWGKIEDITRAQEIMNDRNMRLERETPIEKLTGIQNDLFGKGISYTDACYLIDVANEISVDTMLAKSDFADGFNMGRLITVDRALDMVISKVKEIKEGTLQ